MACGTGKTFTTLWIKEKLGVASTLILLPSLGLLSQTLHEWTLAANQHFDVLCVCSDDTVGKKGADEAIHAITDVAFPVTSNVEEIRRFLCRVGAKVVFSTYQSSPLIAEAQGVVTVPDFDLAIADEAHRCAGKVGNDFTTILDAKLIRARKRLFTTATPRTYSTNVKKAAGERGIDVVGMDDETVFGKVAYALAFGEAIRRGLLTDYQVVIIGVDNPTIAAWIENRELVKTESGIENDAESLAAQIGLLKAYKDYDLHRVISFHSRVKRAEQFSTDLIDVMGWVGDEHKPVGTINADFVSGEMATDRRRKKLSQLKTLAPNERGLLTNARCLSEGVDVPSLDGVAFIDPRSSQIDIIQAVGRAIRLSTNKTAGTVILPVFIEAGIDAEASIEDSNFKPIWDVLNALKAHDDVLSAELDQLRTEMGRKGRTSVDSRALAKIHIDLPATVDQSFGESLRTHLVEQVTATWESWYGMLCTYTDIEGHSCPSIDYVTPIGKKLGQWVSSQRQIRKRLRESQILRLEALPGWDWAPRSSDWWRVFRMLEDYVEKFGTSAVPDSYKTQQGYGLGSWVVKQRKDKPMLDLEKASALESTKGWVWDKRDANWNLGYSKLADFVSKYGHARVPNDYVDLDKFKLGSWVGWNRADRDRMMVARKMKLELLPGWSWDPHEDTWNRGVERLREFVRENGHCDVPVKLVDSVGFRLGAWVQKCKNKRDQLSEERLAQVEAFPGWTWNRRLDSWMKGFDALQKYLSNNNSLDIDKGYKCENGFALGVWVRHQKYQWNRDKKGLSIEFKEKLLSLPGWNKFVEEQ